MSIISLSDWPCYHHNLPLTLRPNQIRSVVIALILAHVIGNFADGLADFSAIHIILIHFAFRVGGEEELKCFFFNIICFRFQNRNKIEYLSLLRMVRQYACTVLR
jgi:hypothetical protein